MLDKLFAMFDKGVPVSDAFNIDKFRGPYRWETFREPLESAKHLTNESEESFKSMLATNDIAEYAYHFRRFIAKSHLADIFMQSALAMVRRNEEIGFNGLNAKKHMRNYWRFNGIQAPEIREAFMNLRVAPVGNPEERMEYDAFNIPNIPIEICDPNHLDEFGHNTSGFGYFY